MIVQRINSRMEKKPHSTRAFRFKRAAIGAFIFLIFPLGCFYFAATRSTSTRLKVMGFATNQIRAFVILQLTNAGPRTITYWGYETNEVKYKFRFPTPDGHVTAGSGNDWSGGGTFWSHSLKGFELRPHESIDFPVFIDNLRQDYQVTLTTPSRLVAG